jgi:hypothetical protein
MKTKMTKYAGTKKSSSCKANFTYPTGTIPTAKVPLSAQKTNPARRNRSY